MTGENQGNESGNGSQSSAGYEDIYPSFFEDYDHYTVAESLTVQIAASIGAFSALAIIMETSADQIKGKGTTISRLLLGLMTFSFIHVACYAVGPLAAPADIGVWGAKGNFTTCSIQGFLQMLGVAGGNCYDSSLSIIYLLMVVRSWRNHHLWQLERWLHPTIVVVALAVSVPGLPLEVYNYDYGVCFSIEFPAGCFDNDEVKCYRGSDYVEPFYVFLFIIYFSTGAISIYTVIRIYLFVRNQEKRNQKYAFSSKGSVAAVLSAGESLEQDEHVNDQQPTETPVNEQQPTETPVNDQQPTETPPTAATERYRKSRRVALQGIMYTSVFFIAFAPGLPATFSEDPGVLRVIENVFAVLHPFFYLFLYFRMRPQDSMQTLYGRVARQIVNAFTDLICCCGFLGGYRQRNLNHATTSRSAMLASGPNQTPEPENRRNGQESLMDCGEEGGQDAALEDSDTHTGMEEAPANTESFVQEPVEDSVEGCSGSETKGIQRKYHAFGAKTNGTSGATEPGT